jgi:hypothetical protein
MKKNLLLLALAAGTCLPAAAQELTWRNDIAPIVKKFCADCHGADSADLAEWALAPEAKRKKVGPRMDTYGTFLGLVGWPDTGAVMRRLDDGTSPLAGGKPGNMYKNLGETDAERAQNLKTIKAWLGEGAWNLNRFAARDSVPGITKEQLEKIKAKY